MTASSGYTIEYDIKGEARKFRCGSKELRRFRNDRRKAAVELALEKGGESHTMLRLVRSELPQEM